MNPAFTRMHPTKNVIYSCTESVEEDGEIVCWDVCPETGKLSLLSSADAFGTSTCYITIDKVGCFSLVWNWKESQLPLCPSFRRPLTLWSSTTGTPPWSSWRWTSGPAPSSSRGSPSPYSTPTKVVHGT